MIITNNVEELKKNNLNSSIEESKDIINKLEDVLSKTSGIGLSAPQIGIHKKVAIVRINKDENINLINPVIIEYLQPCIVYNEGCLSFPNLKKNTYRFKEIFVKDLLHPVGFIVTDILAIAIQHEIDHLESKLIIDFNIKNKIGRNDPCPCGKKENNKPIKFKKCHYNCNI